MGRDRWDRRREYGKEELRFHVSRLRPLITGVCTFRVTAGSAETVSKIGGEKNVLSKTPLETIFSLRSITRHSPKASNLRFCLGLIKSYPSPPPPPPSLPSTPFPFFLPF